MHSSNISIIERLIRPCLYLQVNLFLLIRDCDNYGVVYWEPNQRAPCQFQTVQEVDTC